jgi:hypothetical protein
MKNETPPNAPHSEAFETYENLPFINPEDGDLPTLTWSYTSDSSELLFDTLPKYYLQITPKGEIRGVTFEIDDNKKYFSVAGNGSDVVFLKMYASRYPGTTPSLLDLLPYRQFMHSKFEERNSQIQNQTAKNCTES